MQCKEKLVVDQFVSILPFFLVKLGTSFMFSVRGAELTEGVSSFKQTDQTV